MYILISPQLNVISESESEKDFHLFDPHGREAIFTFSTVDVCRARWPGSGQVSMKHANVTIW